MNVLPGALQIECDTVVWSLEDGAFEGCLSRRMDAVSASGGIREQSDDASRTAPFIFPSDIFSEILSARNDLGSLGLLDTLRFERQTSRPTTRSSLSRLSKIFLRLLLTLNVSDFSSEWLTLSRGGMCRHRYGRQRRCFQGANLEGSATTSLSAFWRTWGCQWSQKFRVRTNFRKMSVKLSCSRCLTARGVC